MPSLDDVTQRFIADTAPYIAALRAAAAAAQDFIDKNALAVASAEKLGGSLRDMGGSAMVSAAAERNLADASADLMTQTALLASMDERLASVQRDVADSSADLMMQTQLLRGAFAEEDGAIDRLIVHLGVLAAANAKAAGGADSAAGAAGTATRAWGRWGITANAIHWIIAGTAEYLAVALPGTIALALGAFVLYQGAIEQVGFRLQSLYTTTEATNAMIGKTTGDVLGLGHAFQTMQDKANPLAFELLGSYINGARANMTNFAAAGYQVDQALAELSARIDIDLRDHAAQFQGLLKDMVSDLVEFGQILGNIGHALLNFASDMPGLAELLLKVADGISKVILWLSELPHWLVLSFMAFEEFNRWGGLVTNMLGRMGGIGDVVSGKWYSLGHAVGTFTGLSYAVPAILSRIVMGFGGLLRVVGNVIPGLDKAGVAVGGFGSDLAEGAAAIPVWAAAIPLVAVGLGFLIDKMVTARTAAQVFGDSLEKDIAASTNADAINTITQSIGKLNEKLAQAPKMVSEMVAMGRAGGESFQTANPAIATYNGYIQKMLDQGGMVAAGADKISRAYGTDFAQSLGIADAAGIKLSSTEITLGAHANVAGQEIENMVAGYKALNQVGGTLGADMNVLAIQSGLADTQVSKLNSAWDQFVGNATAVTSSLASLNQDLTQIGNVGVQVGKKFEVMSGTQVKSINAVAQSLTSFSGTSAQTWQNYDAALNQAQQFTDQLRTASAYGAVSQRNFTGAIADTVASLLPFTAHSKTAVSELAAIAQEAGGPATDNFKTLKDWVDKNKISSQDFNKAIQDMTGQMSNAGKAAAEFASTLQQQMQSALASALIKGSNLNTVVGQFQQAVLKAGGQISASSPQYKQLQSMLEAAGLTAQQAKTEIQILQNTIDQMHGKTVSINTVFHTFGADPTNQSLPGGYPGAPGAYHGGVFGFAGGGMVNGPGGMDKATLASLTAGEAVLNARAVAAIGGPMSIHSLNNQPSHAVLTGGGGGGGGGGVMNLTQHVVVELDGTKIAQQWRTSQLTYNRRNNSANTQLRVR